MRDNYLKYISNNNIPDILSRIPDLKYSKKLEYVKWLFDTYGGMITNLTLLEYEREYIDIKRVNLFIIENVLKSLANRYQLVVDLQKSNEVKMG